MSPFTRHTRKHAYTQKRTVACEQGTSLRIRVAAIAALLASTTLYVMQVNAVSVQGFTMFEIEQRITALERENQRLGLHLAQLQSTETLQLAIAQLGMTGEGETEYITVAPDAVAVR